MVLRVVVLTVVYLLVLTSVRTWVMSSPVLWCRCCLWMAGRRIGSRGPAVGEPLARRLVGVPALVGGTLVDLVASTWRTVRWCLTPRRTPAGLVTVAIPACTAPSAAAWGVRLGITSDTVVVELDEEQGRMLLHVLDARVPDAIRADQLRSYQRRQRRVFP